MKNLGQLHEEREELDATKGALNDTLKTVKEQIEELDLKILKILDDQGVEYLVVGTRRYGINNQVVPSVKDWDALYHWILENKAPFLLQRRVTATAYEEFVDAGEIPDGIIPVQLHKLKVTKR